jgi:hypothetical protein
MLPMDDASMPAPWVADAARDSVQVFRDSNGRCRMHGGASTGPRKGIKNAFKHGRYTAESIAFLRRVGALNKESKVLADAF